jgi:hypothetical protein
MTRSENSFGVKSAGLQYQTILIRLLLICLVSLTGCVSQQARPVLCDPTPPKLQWSQTDDGGATLSKQALGELVNYIHDLRECAQSR